MLIPRILTALVGIPVVIACIYYGGLAFYIMFFAVILFSVMEFFSVCKKYKPICISFIFKRIFIFFINYIHHFYIFIIYIYFISKITEI